MAAAAPLPAVPVGMDPAFYALSLFRRRRLDACLEHANALLEKNAYDQQLWYLKARALTRQSWLDDTEVEEEGIAEVLLDEAGMSAVPRPGTSLRAGMASRGGTASGRPVSHSGVRAPSGYARPGSQSRNTASRQGGIEAAFQGSRPGTSRPVSSSGRFVRLGTASMKSEAGGPFIDADRLDLKKYAQRPPMAKALIEYLVYVDRNAKRGLELCAEASEAARFEDWFWKARLGKCYYQLGLHRDAEKQFLSALKHGPYVVAALELAKVHYKLDQPLSALDLFERTATGNPHDTHVLVGAARTYDQLGDSDKAVELYKRVAAVDPGNTEAIACLAAAAFYEDQPEVALRLYRRLLQMGLSNAELWNNLGLCCFYASQYDMSLSCLDRALTLAQDGNMADVWFNVGQVSIGIGDLGLAYQAFKVAVSVDGAHAEAYNNLAVLELRKGNVEAARNAFSAAARGSAPCHEALYNGALLALRLGEFQEAHNQVTKALEICPEHAEGLELRKQLKQRLNVY